MSEHEPWQVTGERIAKIAEELGDPIQVNDIMILYMEPDWATGDGVFKGECQTCGAYSTMRASHKSQLLYLASVIERYECPKNGHAREAKK